MVANANSIVQHLARTFNLSTKTIVRAKKIIAGIYLPEWQVFKKCCWWFKNLCHEIIYVINIVSTKKTNTLALNVPINYQNEKVKHKTDCYILHAVLLVIMLLLVIIIICYHYAKQRLHVNILIYDISYKILLIQNLLRIRFDKMDGFTRIYDWARYLILLGYEKLDAVYNRIRYIFSHYYANTTVGSYDSLPIAKIFTLHNLIILIKLEKTVILQVFRLFLVMIC